MLKYGILGLFLIFCVSIFIQTKSSTKFLLAKNIKKQKIKTRSINRHEILIEDDENTLKKVKKEARALEEELDSFYSKDDSIRKSSSDFGDVEIHWENRDIASKKKKKATEDEDEDSKKEDENEDKDSSKELDPEIKIPDRRFK